MFKVLLGIFLVLKYNPLLAQEYHYSKSYEDDTAAYEAKKRELINKYDDELRKKPKKIMPLDSGVYWLSEFVQQRDKRLSEGWDVECGLKGLEYYEKDTLQVVFEVWCHPLRMNWQRHYEIKCDYYKNGNLCTKGEFIILSWNEYKVSMAINRHIYYRRNGKIRSVATFNKYGLPISDSLFDKKGRFKEVKEIQIQDRVPLR